MSEEKEPTTEEKEEKKDDSGEPITIDKVKEAIHEIVDPALESLRKLVGGDDDSEDDDKGDDGKTKDDKTSGRTRRTYRTIEEDAERLVREAWEKVSGEKEEEAKAKKDKEEKEAKKKPEPEKAPIKVRRLTRIMLGKDYGQE